MAHITNRAYSRYFINKTYIVQKLLQANATCNPCYKHSLHSFFANPQCPILCGKPISELSNVHTLPLSQYMLTRRSYSDKEPEKTTGKEIDVTRENPYAGLSTGEKVKEASKDLSYLVVILAGIGVMGVMFYTLGKELFSKQSPGGVYKEALKIVKKNDEVIDNLGEPIVGHGTAGGRKRKQHVMSHEFMVDGVKHMRIQFHVNGPYRKGTVHVEVYHDDSGRYQYKYLIVELEGFPTKTIVIEDNR